MKRLFCLSMTRVVLASTTVVALVLLLAVSQSCLADSITLASSGSGVYDYGLTVSSGGVMFNLNQTITLSGLSGVTGASVASALSPSGGFGGFTVSSVTSTSVVFAQTGSSTIGFDGPFTWGTLVVDSSVLTTGTVDFSMQTSNEGTITGTVQGPVGAVPAPEASSLALLGVVLLAGLWIGRKRIFAHAAGL